MELNAFAEQRAHERRPLRTQVELLLPDRPAMAMRTTDISVTGIGLVASANPPLGLRVGLRIPLPNPGTALAPSTVFEVQALVRHSVYSVRENGFRIGMVFVQPTDKLIVAIGNYIAR
ncbi:PilZ domain-containing protein [Inhella sp.]|uniref:PilZ domain-containing protein n=1 Tax=Inhella sp. TaxID=1921806 RepID=UPI0035B0C4C1